MKELLDVEPDFETITDIDLIGLLSYCENWLPEKVYDTAYSQVFPEKQIKEVKTPFEQWVEGPRTLPDVVRYELVRATQKNFELGKMNALKYTWLGKQFLKNTLFWIFILLVLWWWL